MGVRESELLIELIELSLGYWRAQVLFTSHELGVFKVLADTQKDVAQLARECGASRNYLQRLLNACAAMGLLKKEGENFRNLPMAETFLVEGKPRYMGHWVQLLKDWYRPWGQLDKAIRTGKPVEDPLEHLGKDYNYTRNFILAMHDYAAGPGRQMVHHVDLKGRKKLLDLGGGPGTYSVMLAQKYPDLKCVVFDLPDVVKITSEVIASHRLSDRVTVQAGDYSRDDFGRGYDAALLSNMLHQEDRQACLQLLQKTYAALEKGGLLIVQAMFLNAQMDGPVWPVLHSLLLLLLYQGGRAYSLEETLELTREAGFVEPQVKRMAFTSAESLIFARKP